MPNFARRYNMECTACHTVIPRLNEFGYQFRAAGYRMPEEIGKTETPTKFGDFTAFREQLSFVYSHSKDAAGNTSSSTQGVFNEITFYPITMSFAKNWSTIVELSMVPDGTAEIENGYLRYNWGKQDLFFSLRGGVFHPFEGYGASDRPISLSRPLFETVMPNYNQPTLYKLWGIDQVGVDFQVHYNRTALSFTVFNGLNSSGEPAKGGGLVKTQAANPSSFNSKDIQMLVNQILTDDGGGLSVLYYHGNVDLPVKNTSNYFQNSYDRLAFFASYPVVKNSLLLAGYGYGSDKSYDYTANSVDGTFNSNGYFAEFDYGVNDNLWLGLRYDNFDPATNKSSNSINAITLCANVPLNNGIQFIAEYQNKTTQTPAGNATYGQFQVRAIAIW
ncbi:MAG: hypothetical protein ACP5US_03390 [Candidatus Kryptoniota bacterium]